LALSTEQREYSSKEKRSGEECRFGQMLFVILPEGPNRWPFEHIHRRKRKSMANFVLLYIGGSMAESEAEQAAVMEAWGAWFAGLGSALVDGGNPFTPVVKSIESNGQVTNGPIGIAATGYSILKANSLDAAMELAKGCPVLQSGGQISVYEAFPIM
jgi:hypothetical protein